ncbi:MAG: VWA domain-containing protein, partial [Pseudomonadota bacterium]
MSMKRVAVFVAALTALSFVPATAQQVTLEAPDEVAAGAPFKVTFSTDRSAKDYIYYTDVGEDPASYKHGYFPASRGSPLKLRALVTPGTYAVRYVTDDKPPVILAEETVSVTDVTATVAAPASVVAGSEFKVRATGPMHQRDYIALTDPGADDNDYRYGYVYTRKANDAGDVTFVAPIVPGDYSLRYMLEGKPKDRKLAETTFSVTDVTATVQPPTEPIEAGAKFDVAWEGPDSRQDFIALTDSDGEPHSYTYGYAYTQKGNPATLTAPTTPGTYLVRYVMRGQTAGQKHRDLAEASIVVGSVEATLDAPATVVAGAKFQVAFTKPEGSRGYIAIGDVDSEGIDYRYGYQTARDKPVTLTAPDSAGEYTIRYIQEGNKDVILATAPLAVTPVSASLTVPESVVARSEFAVGWTGPDNDRDYIELEIDGVAESYAYTRRGNPVTLKAPDEPGEYPVIYMMNKRELAREMITVTPGVSYGELRVVSSRTSRIDATSGVLVILDASGSMWQKLDGRFRIEVAREALVNLVTETIPADTPFAFRAFGQREARSCRTDLEIPLAPLDADAAVEAINNIEPQELSKTPIAASLARVGDDLAGVNGERVVVLVTDGEETCDGDPEAAIRELTASGIDVRVNIVGFAIDEYALQKTFESWAQLGNGTYLDARKADELADAISQAVNSPFEVLDADGNIIATGTSNGDA